MRNTKLSGPERGLTPGGKTLTVNVGIHQAIREWLQDPIGAETRLRVYLTRIVEGALREKNFSAAAAMLTTALRFGPGEVSKLDVQHAGKILMDQNVLVLPGTMSVEDWRKQHEPQPVVDGKEH